MKSLFPIQSTLEKTFSSYLNVNLIFKFFLKKSIVKNYLMHFEREYLGNDEFGAN